MPLIRRVTASGWTAPSSPRLARISGLLGDRRPICGQRIEPLLADSLRRWGCAVAVAEIHGESEDLWLVGLDHVAPKRVHRRIGRQLLTVYSEKRFVSGLRRHFLYVIIVVPVAEGESGDLDAQLLLQHLLRSILIPQPRFAVRPLDLQVPPASRHGRRYDFGCPRRRPALPHSSNCTQVREPPSDFGPPFTWSV